MFKSILLLPLFLFPASHKEYHVIHSHKKVDATTVAYLVAEEDGYPKKYLTVRKRKSYLTDISAIELKFDADEKKTSVSI